MEEKKSSKYKFEGHVIKLNEKDFILWKEMYYGIPDLKAELYNLDTYYHDQEIENKEKIKNWFVRTSTYLNKKHQHYIYTMRESRKKVSTEWRTDKGDM